MAISKIILNGVTQMDVTQDTVASTNLLSGYTATKNDGTKVSGSYVPPSAPTLQTKSVSYTPSETAQDGTVTPDSGYDGLDEVNVSVGAISSTYVGSGITRRSSSDLTVSGATVTAPSGYYSASASKSVASGTAGTPTATKGTVSNHSVSVTPSVTNTTGYITGGTKSGTAVSVSASELVSGTLNIASSGIADVTNYASVDVPRGSNGSAIWSEAYSTSSGQRRWRSSVEIKRASSGWTDQGSSYFYAEYHNAVPSNTSVTPTTSSQTIGGADYMMEGAVTVNPIPSQYIIPSGTLNITSSGTKDVTNYASANVPSLTLPSSTDSYTIGTVKGNIIPSTGFNATFLNIPTGFNNTAQYYQVDPVPLDALTVTSNGTYDPATYDCAGFSSVTVNVSGGGGSSVQVESVWQSSSTSSSVVFSNLKGNPTSFAIYIDGGGITPSATPMTDAIVFDGTNLHGQTIVSGTNAVVYDDTSYSKSYSNGTLTITSASKAFDTNYGYVMTYSYGGSASNIGTKDVQVGSGATSITFTGLTHEPLYWSCIFKGNFGTSSGYQRVIFVNKDGNIYGHCMDSATRESSSYWTASYSGGNLTITSQGTNQGGYFHQPGYYQLTYAIDESAPSYQTKTVTPTTSQQVVTADSGYDALSQVTVNAMPTGVATSATTISGTAATVSTGTNTLTLTKTVSNTPRITTAGYISAGTAGNSSVTLTANVTTKAAATITPGTTNQTIAAGTYLTGAQTIAGDADLVASNIVSGVQIFGVTGNVVLQNYYTGSSAPSSSTGSNGDLYLQS